MNQTKIDRPYWNMEMESLLGTQRMSEIQWERLKEQLKYIYTQSEYHRERFDKAGVRPDDIRSWDDFSSGVPFFTKEDHRRSQEESIERFGHGLGIHLCVRQEEITLMCATTGTTGQPTFYLFTKEDLEIWNEGRARTFWRVGLRPGDRLLHAFGLGMFIGGVPNVLGAQHFGLSLVPVGAESGTERILKFARLTRPRAMICTPSLAGHLIERSPQVIDEDVGSLGIKVLLCGGEPGAGIPDVRKRLQDAYGARLFDIQGPTPSCDHEEYQGMHRIMDDYVINELVDPDTKNPMSIEDGIKGELVTTQLKARGAPFIRYATGDIHQFFTKPCACGLSGFRSRIVGRTDDMLKVKGILVYPAGIKNVLTGFIPRVTGEFRIILDEPPPRIVPPLKIKVEYGEGIGDNQREGLKKEIQEKMHQSIKVRPEIEWVSPMSLERTTHKTRYLEKRYEKRSRELWVNGK